MVHCNEVFTTFGLSLKLFAQLLHFFHLLGDLPLKSFSILVHLSLLRTSHLFESVTLMDGLFAPHKLLLEPLDHSFALTKFLSHLIAVLFVGLAVLQFALQCCIAI